MTDETGSDLLGLTAEIVSSHVSHNRVLATELPGLIECVHASLARLGAPGPGERPQHEPTITTRAARGRDHLVCFECKAKMKMLKRHLLADHHLSPEAYRAKWRLPSDYPMVAAAYARKRRDLALSIGLGRKRGGAIAHTGTSALGVQGAAADHSGQLRDAAGLEQPSTRSPELGIAMR